MNKFKVTISIAGVLFSLPLWAWSNHTVAAYRAFEKMPEVAQAQAVTAESLESFLRAEEKTLEALLDSQEAWAKSNLEKYPTRPAALEFKADASRSDEARRLAFLKALRVAPNSKFALYIQPDQRSAVVHTKTLAHSAVNTLPEPKITTHLFIPLAIGEKVSAVEVLASASDEPDYGLDINLWEDSPSDWGKSYGFGKLPFGNPALSFSTQAPFHMGFMHENSILYLAAPFIKRTYPQLRVHQFSTLASLAFRTGHPYWGWRFAGIALHYIQDLTQPYHANLSPGDSTLKLLTINALAMMGMPAKKEATIVLLSNRHLALEKYQSELLHDAASHRKDTDADKALRSTDKDRDYPDWNDHYLRDTVSAEAAAAGPQLAQTLMKTLPSAYVSDPTFDFGVREAEINLMSEVAHRDPGDKAQLEAAIANLLGHFGSHSRNTVRGILRASSQP